MARPSPLSRPGPLMQSGLGPPLAGDVITYAGHVGADVAAALDGRPPTHVEASTDPTVTDDDTDGHVVGCRWINLAGAEEFVAVDVSTGAAVWESTTAGGGGSLDVTDGTTTVSPTTNLDFDPTYFDVVSPGGGVAEVTFIGSGGGVDVEDEGTPLATTATTLDFVGAGVTATGAGATKTITIPGGGGGGDLEFIDEVVVSGSSAADITITGIPNTYRDLVITGAARVVGAGEFDTLNLRVGDGSIDTGSNYSSARGIFGSGSAAPLGGRNGTLINLLTCTASGATANAFGGFMLEIFGYADTSMFKVCSYMGFMDGATDFYTSWGGGIWKNAAGEIDQVRIFGGSNLAIGSRLTVWGRSI